MKRKKASPPLPKLPSVDAWERAWQKYWRKVGQPGYELPPTEDTEFLNEARTRHKGRQRLKCVNEEFTRAFAQFMMKQGVFARDEIGFGHVTDSPREAVDLIVRSLPPGVRPRLRPEKS